MAGPMHEAANVKRRPETQASPAERRRRLWARPWLGYGRRFWAASVYGLWCAVAGIAVSLAVFVLLATGVAFAVVWVGIPVLLAALVMARMHLVAELWMQRRFLDRRTTLPPWPRREFPLRTHVRLLLTERMTWVNLAWTLGSFAIGITWLVGLSMLIICILVFGTAPLWYAADIEASSLVSSWPTAIAALFFGWAVAAVTPPIVVGAAKATATVAGGVARSRGETLDRLRAERDRSIASAEYARRRVERDLHDGVQPHLMATAMTLARIQRRAGENPELRPLVDESLAHLTTGMNELRRLVRGLGPASLDDTDLVPALRGLAAGIPARLTVRGDLGTLPPPVKAAAYFVASEAVHNAVQHGQASEITIDLGLTGEGAAVEIVVTDNGGGGAKMTPGGGLAGLRDRTGALGGTIALESPAGGPTVVRAAIPCES
ncbi:MAG: hypothetical protein FIB00_16600 [Chloroflexi bacterium]|nr:hypothetical protein [Chloroflexota bacterium]PWB43407.1 MAG: hypothetical protein C3F10_12050 [Dehalococcoidia bacterium]